ncbi:MAG: tetrathionate reductase family octaheme c-type cytochrome [Ignavibacteria bacterium]|jgi:octaheme c-type cytochrome (tetrathionate reductase family)|nr:tetrathionate reductase family octaheme c-type cytochrome [Ignavibacteria bacterium]MCU7504623.1 tetrathionate reductase family octaheme c-type cytochrome [Ignavibacteria bacterium]MCU7517961.1 tetrathionate reductase family octaheme c-type cytochrome [Ignavibacteria bacterium]
MRKIILLLSAACIAALAVVGTLKKKDHEESALEKLREKYSVKHSPSVDHSKFAVLKQKFSSPQQVTGACISCHNERHTEVMKSNHWNWEREEYVKGRGIVYLGKKNAINNFCIGVQGNEQSCAKCHIGYGLSGGEMNYKDPNNIDCLVCHDNTETYAKANEKGGAPDASLDLNNIAQHVGRPERSNCGVCHFFGGGGNNVKHGDLDKAMFQPSREVDVHMASEGANMQCVDCHLTDKHNISGKLYSLSSMNHNRVTCEQCHTENPHESEVLNEHTLKVACQTCHISTYAKANYTKKSWDWSAAGKLKNGEPFIEEDSKGNDTYMSIKGKFVWGKELKPEYIWFNGNATHYLLGDKIKDTSAPLMLNPFAGNYKDTESKIIPVKIHRARQPFDPVNMLLIQPKLYAENKGEGAFWKDFNWQKSAEEGMKEAGLPFSGRVSFMRTESNWPVNHMVATKENAVKCNECHTRENGRLAALNDFYMPGRNYSSLIDGLGKFLLWATLLAILVHGGLRIAGSLKKKGAKQ